MSDWDISCLQSQVFCYTDWDTLFSMHNLVSVTCELHAPPPFSHSVCFLTNLTKHPLNPALPAIVEVELWMGARWLRDWALLGSCWCRRTSHRLVCLSWCLAGLDWCLSGCLTWLSDHLARLRASLACLGYRTGLGLWAVFLGHGALLL